MAATPRKTESSPGDISRGTQEKGSTRQAEPRTPAQEFAARQSFADPVHLGKRGQGGIPPSGGLRTQETGSEEGGRTPRRAATTTTSRRSLEAAAEEE